MATEYITWIPPNGGEHITFGLQAPYILLRRDGGLSVQSIPILNQAPGQHGTTLVDTEITTRMQALSIVIKGGTKQELWEQRARLAKALVSLPARPGGSAQAGILRMYRSGLPVVELPAVPHMSPMEGDRYPTWMYADLEFHCPYPFWRALSDSNIQLMPGETGMTFPMEFPFAMEAGHSEADVVNAGDVPAPVLIRVWGEITTPRIINSTTGESIEVSGSIAEGEFLEISTAFGDKRVELVHNDGTRENWMSNLNLDDSDFWHLATGLNTVRLQADANVSGTAWVTWRNRYAGV